MVFNTGILSNYLLPIEPLHKIWMLFFMNKQTKKAFSFICEKIVGINRGIFGVPSAKMSEIEDLVKLLESQSPNPNPTSNLDKVILFSGSHHVSLASL